MKKTLLSLAALLTGMVGMAQQKTVDLTTAGQLSTQISESEKYSITDLTITGKVNGDDIALIRDMAGKDAENEATEGQLQLLDLSGAAIEAGGVYYTDMQSATDFKAEANVVGDNMFRDLKLTSVALPAGTSKIGYRAFYNDAALATISGVENVAELGNAAFESCSALDGVKLSAALTEIPEALFKRCEALDNVEIPAGITKINDEAFYGCKLSNLSLPEGLVSIGTEALASTGVTALTLPSTMKELGNYSLYSCDNLAEITLNDGLETIGEGALAYNDAIKEYNIPSTVTSIGESAFGKCGSLEKVVLPEGIEEIPAYCFDRCEVLTTVNFPSTLKTIGERAFQLCYAVSPVELPEGLETIGDGAFVDCSSITELLLPSTLRNIGTEAFASTGLSEIVIPEGVTRLGGEGDMWMPGGSVFSWCNNLAKVELPSTIEVLGMMTFDGCPLTDLTIHAVTPPNIVGFQNNPFGFDESIYEACTIHVPAEALETYKSDEGWSQFLNIVADTTTGINEIRNETHSNDIYMLNGQRAASVVKGIYIINGKKVLVK